MNHLLVILSIVYFCSLIICPAGLAQNDNLIVPGERIGPIHLGMLLDEVVSVLGRPEKMVSSATASGVFWRWPSLGLGIGFSKNQPAPYVGRVETESARNITREGIRVGDSTFDVVRALGKPLHTEPCCMYYNGLMVEVDNYHIWRISVFSLDYLNNWYYEIEVRGQEATMHKMPKYDIQQDTGYSDAMWPLIPIQGGHPFRSKMATYSDRLWPVIPTQFAHP
jgi:hypothetical protein